MQFVKAFTFCRFAVVGKVFHGKNPLLHCKGDVLFLHTTGDKGCYKRARSGRKKGNRRTRTDSKEQAGELVDGHNRGSASLKGSCSHHDPIINLTTACQPSISQTLQTRHSSAPVQMDPRWMALQPGLWVMVQGESWVVIPGLKDEEEKPNGTHGCKLSSNRVTPSLQSNCAPLSTSR